MRSLSGTRNRTVLVLAGLLTLIAAAWLLAVTFALDVSGTPIRDLLVSGDQTVSDVVGQHSGCLLPVASVLAVVAVLAGLALLVAQIPSAPAHTQLRFHDDDGRVSATLEPQVLERALEERVDGVPGIVGSSLRLSGSAAAPHVQGEVTVSDGAEVEWAVDEARRLLADDLETTLDAVPRRIDLLVRLRSPRSGTHGGRVAVTRQDEGGALVSGAA